MRGQVHNDEVTSSFARDLFKSWANELSRLRYFRMLSQRSPGSRVAKVDNILSEKKSRWVKEHTTAKIKARSYS